MKLEIKTVYENVDQHWLEWWIENNAPNYGVDLKSDKPVFPIELKSKDPTSNVIGTTTVKLKEQNSVSILEKET